jgi:hypothetical protein
MNENDIFLLERVTGLPPLQFFGQPTVKSDHPQFLKFLPPLFGFAYYPIHLGVLSIHF